MNTRNNKWVFFGTDEFAAAVLKECKKAEFLPQLAVTAPDKPQGRKLKLTPPPVKVWAQENNISVIQPETLSAVPRELRSESWDIFVVASYGKIIPRAIINIPEHGTLNIHPSLLPLHRGASPIQTAILSGDQYTGVTIMLLDEKMDHGPILAQETVPVEDEYYKELRDKLARLGATLLLETIPEWTAGSISPQPQEHTKATYTDKITKKDGEIDLAGNPEKNMRKIRALTPRPGTYFFDTDKNGNKIRVKITEAHLENSALIIDRVIPEGRKEIRWNEYRKSR